MEERDVKAVCRAAALGFDPEMMESLAVIGGMMEAVAASALCTDGGTVAEAGDESPLRRDVVVQDFTREEMLSGAKRRQGDFVPVPRVIG